MALKMHPSLAVHVGDWLKTEIVEPAQVSVTALAEHFGVSRQALSTLLNGNANLSADMAIRFEKAFGIKADTLLRMQTTYELAQAREHESSGLAGRAGDLDELHNEAADLLYHLSVLLMARDTKLENVLDILRERHKG